MKKYFIIILTILSVNVYSQKGFYLRPSYERKFATSNFRPYTVTTAQGYTINIRPYRMYLLGRYIGLNFGYRTKKYFFEMGWAQDDANQGADLSVQVFYPRDSSFHQYQIGGHMGMIYNRFPLRMGIKLFGKDSVSTGKKLRWQGFLFGGYDFLTRPPIPAEGEIYDTFVIDKQGRTIEYESELGSNLRYGILKTLGFMLKVYNKKGRSVVNFSVHFSQGKKFSYTSYTSFKFTNYDGSIYKSYIGSNSSGLYFTLSTDLYPKNWFKKKEQLDYYKKKQ